MEDEWLALIADPDRRQILYTLLESEDSWPIAEDELSGRSPLQLQHNHLPKLDAADLIEWEPDDGTVATGDRFDDAQPLLECLREHVAPPGGSDRGQLHRAG